MVLGASISGALRPIFFFRTSSMRQPRVMVSTSHTSSRRALPHTTHLTFGPSGSMGSSSLFKGARRVQGVRKQKVRNRVFSLLARGLEHRGRCKSTCGKHKW